MRARNKKWAAGELENNPRIIREPVSENGDIKKYFANNNPLHLEVGCGKGRFITETSLRNPQINYIALEREAVILAAAARKAQELAPDSQLYFLLADVDNLLDLFMPGDISRLYINFCDPWPRKKKWAKRRLTHDNYLAKYQELAIPEIHFKTDNQILFEASLESFSRMKWTLQNVSLNLHASNMPDNVMTEYEEKFSPHGPIYRLEALPPQSHF